MPLPPPPPNLPLSLSHTHTHTHAHTHTFSLAYIYIHCHKTPPSSTRHTHSHTSLDRSVYLNNYFSEFFIILHNKHWQCNTPSIIKSTYYKPLKLNQTAPLVKPYTMVKTVQRADHAQLGSLTAVGKKELPLLLVLYASNLNRHPWGKCLSSPMQGMLGAL